MTRNKAIQMAIKELQKKARIEHGIAYPYLIEQIKDKNTQAYEYSIKYTETNKAIEILDAMRRQKTMTLI